MYAGYCAAQEHTRSLVEYWDVYLSLYHFTGSNETIGLPGLVKVTAESHLHTASVKWGFNKESYVNAGPQPADSGQWID